MLGTLGLLKRMDVSPGSRLSVAALLSGLLIVLGYVAARGIPETFSRDALLQRIRTQDEMIASANSSLEKLQKEILDARSQLQFATIDIERSQASYANAQRQIQILQQQKDKLQADYANAQQQQPRSDLSLSAAVPGNCSLLVLDNMTSTPIDLSGWLLEAPPKLWRVTLGSGALIPPNSSLTVLVGAECPTLATAMNRVGQNIFVPEEYIKDFLSPGGDRYD